MKISYENGAIVAVRKWHEETLYNVSSDSLSLQFNGKGGVTKYRRLNGKNLITDRTFLTFAINGKKVSPYDNKRVKMLGRGQTLEFTPCGESGAGGAGGEDSANAWKITLLHFVPKSGRGVFFEVTFAAVKESKFECIAESGVFGDEKEDDELENVNFVRDGDFIFACSEAGRFVRFNHAFYYEENGVKAKTLRFVFCFGETEQTARESFYGFTKYKKEYESEIAAVRLPDSAQTEEEKAAYYSSYFCALENYKEIGDFAGFCAGADYIDPVRTYFRDSYFTCLAMYEGHAELIRRQILTLARGVGARGECPSAVVYDFKNFWGDHYDSPSFFLLFIYDYTAHTQDFSLLFETVNGKTVYELLKSVTERLLSLTDETGLIVKRGRHNKRDWADLVNRNGYVTYVEGLYARAMYCAAQLCRYRGENELSEKYFAAYETAKKSINEILWNEEKGYFVNFIDGDFTEENLSLDTIVILLFGLTDDGRANRVLVQMEKILETRNNRKQQAGDFGVMCVYPCYSRRESVMRKSSQDYEYHNGSNWPYLSGLYAYARAVYGREYDYPVLSWFTYNANRGNFTPIEYFAPCVKDGSLLQAWGGTCAFAYAQAGKGNFFKKTLSGEEEK